MKRQKGEVPSLELSSQFPEKYKFLRKTNAFKDLYLNHEDIVARKSFNGFKIAFDDQFTKLHEGVSWPREEALRRLYERGIDAAVERLWVKRARATKLSVGWKTHRSWMRRIIRLIPGLEPLLRSGDRSLVAEPELQKAESIARSLQKLRRRFVEIQQFDERLEQIADLRNWNSSLSSARIKMNGILEKECPSLTKTQRIEITRLTVEWTELNPAESEDAVARQLRPSRSGNSEKAP